jgi:AraC family transcriptional regulator, transcriptional activator of pobA
MHPQPETRTTGANSIDLKIKGFKVYTIDLPASRTHPNTRRDFYRIVLTTAR